MMSDRPSPFATVPRSVLQHVVDVHCHPTDSDTPPGLLAALPIRLCAMATRQNDQPLVRALAHAHPDKIVPCFGYHPWFAHWIALAPVASKAEHYRALFLDAPTPTADLVAAFDRLLPYLPDPIILAEVLAGLRADLTTFPSAMLGEVGLDRACRIPYASPECPPYSAAEADTPRALSPFTIPLAHQLAVLEAQLALAAELGRNVSMHSVKCQQSWHQIEKKHTNVFLSLSTVINARSPAHKALITACSPHRILVESDFHDVQYSAERTWEMLLIIAEVKGWHVEESWDEDYEKAGEERWGAVRRLEENWKAFERGGHRPATKKNDRRKLLLEEWESDEGDSE
ncbi:Cut9-interacting protein scn1 [Grifola frondosa]|uniref:Cut9-interacting protein scn1 n=1 Tax=Grifola frondosa TaxID=5627 RepID=A0A1C7MU12_GRIFR|nr:Cut9-interacting protein scn1 [Grifola frondosa]